MSTEQIDITKTKTIQSNDRTSRETAMHPQAENQPLIDLKRAPQFDTNEEPGNEGGTVDCHVRMTTFSPLSRQLLGAMGPVAAVVSTGMTSGFSATLLPQLEHENSTMTITQAQSSWIASMAVVSMILGCVLCGLFMERLGRRISHQIICVPFVVGWVILSFASNVAMLYLGRFITGLCVGLLTPLSTVYIAETSGPKYRGVIMAVIPLGVALGILLAHILGTFLRWQLVAGISGVLPFLCYVIISTVPESPSWLAAKGRPQEAQLAFSWFRGYDAEATSEIQQLIKKHEDDQKPGSDGKPRNKWTEQLNLMSQSCFMKPFLIMNVFFVVQQFSGVNAVTFYTVSILREFGGGVDEYLVTVVMDVVRVVMSVVACLLLRRLGRRPLAIVSGVGTTLSLLGLATLLTTGASHQSYTWLPSALFILYICSISIGLVPLPWLMIGEVFPAATRGLGSGLTSCWGFIVFFTVVKSAPAMVASLGAGGTFFVYAAVALCGTLFLYAALPETSNRTLQEIEDSYRGERNRS